MRVGVRALESGVVPRNLIMLVGRTSANQVFNDIAALFASKLVLPQPPCDETKNPFIKFPTLTYNFDRLPHSGVKSLRNWCVYFKC